MPPSPDSPGTRSDAITTGVPESPEEPDSEEKALDKESKKKKDGEKGTGRGAEAKKKEEAAAVPSETPELVSVSSDEESSIESDKSSRKQRKQKQKKSKKSSKKQASPKKEQRVAVPFHPDRQPRRSSFKGSAPSAPERRASTGSIVEIQLPGQKETIKRRRSINFNESVVVRRIQTAKSLANEPSDLWFTESDYAEIKRKTRALLKNVDPRTGLSKKGERFCVRGLEKFSSQSYNQQREATKFLAVDSVLLEQRMQNAERKYDDESMSKTYRRMTTRSILEAARLADMDAKEVAAMHSAEQRMRSGI